MGDMAVSNSIGSNIFDILLGLGFPWALRTLIVEHGSSVRLTLPHCVILVLSRGFRFDGCEMVTSEFEFLPHGQVSINNKGLVYSVILLLASVFLTVRKINSSANVAFNNLTSAVGVMI